MSPIAGDVADQLQALVRTRPDATVQEMLNSLVASTGVGTSLSAMKRALHRLGLTKERKFIATERDEPHNLTRRRLVSATLTIIAPERLVFLDESSCSTDMAREYGWALHKIPSRLEPLRILPSPAPPKPFNFPQRRGAHRSCAEAQQRARASVEVSRVAIDCRVRDNLSLGGDSHVATNELAMRSSVVVGGRRHA